MAKQEKDFWDTIADWFKKVLWVVFVIATLGGSATPAASMARNAQGYMSMGATNYAVFKDEFDKKK
ncbi:MAG: hypothetical protein LBH41_01380 [Rickettsiales bacterium]|nr:hypothetical protein [Rickettsiales bacterium]